VVTTPSPIMHNLLGITVPYQFIGPRTNRSYNSRYGPNSAEDATNAYTLCYEIRSVRTPELSS